eukprot:INCI16334.1.p1 GENE.INCI16334.1~~INCI16334.1.p1  ORF type:complete len:1994 (+),score=433.30 INCI16334.1:160-6141(+)
MGATGSVPADRKAEVGGAAVAAFHRAVEMFELDPEGMIVMMNCILTETTSGKMSLADYYEAEKEHLESDWREILRLTSSHEHALKLFKEAYEIFRAADEESRHGVGEDGVKERRQLQTFLAEALELKLLTRRDIERIEEEIAAGTRPVTYFLNVWRRKVLQERSRVEGQAKTLEFARQERLRLELLEEDERALARGNHRGTANMTRLTVAEDPSANPLLWLQDGAIGRSSYVADYLHAPTFHQQFIERALTNAPKDNGLSSDVSSYGGEAGLIKRAVEQAAANPNSSRRSKNGRHVGRGRRKAKDRHLELHFSSHGHEPHEVDDGDVQEQKLKRTLLQTLKDGSEEVQAKLLMEQAQLPLYEREFWSDWRHRWRNLDGDGAIAQLKRRLRHILKDEARAARVKEMGARTRDSNHVTNSSAASPVPKELLKVDKDGCTALHHASFGVPAAAVGALVKACPSMAAIRDKDGLVPLHYCVRFGLPGAVEKILTYAPESARLQCSSQNINGWLPLHVAVRYGASAAVISALLKAYRDSAKCWATDAASRATGLDKVIKDNGQLALHMCAREAAWMAAASSFADWHRTWPSSEAVCRLLIKAFAQAASIPDRYGRLPIHYIARACCPEHQNSDVAGDAIDDVAAGLIKSAEDEANKASPRPSEMSPLTARPTARTSRDEPTVPLEDGAPLSMVISLLAANPAGVYVPDKDGQLPIHPRIILYAMDRFYETLMNFSSRRRRYRRAVEDQVAHGLLGKEEGELLIHENESLKVGDRVLLSLSVVEQKDWQRGPMRIGDYGVIVDHDPSDPELPFKVVKTGYNVSYWYASTSLVLNSGYDWQCLRAIIDGYPEGFVAVAGDRLQAAIAVMCSMLDENQRFDTYALIKPERLPTKLESEFNLRGKLRAAAYSKGGLDFEALFSQFDSDGSGELDLEEFGAAMRKAAKISVNDVTDEELEEMFNLVDADHSGDVDVDEFCTWLGDGEGEYDKNKVSSVPNVELVAAADGGYTIPDIKRVLRVCLQNRDVRTYLSNPRRYATLKEAAETRLEQIEHDLEELFYAEELPDKLGQLCKGQVIIDEEAPLKDKIGRVSDAMLADELAKRGVSKVTGSRSFREQKLLELLKHEEAEAERKAKLLHAERQNDSHSASSGDDSDAENVGMGDGEQKVNSEEAATAAALELAEDPAKRLKRVNEACLKIFLEHTNGEEMASVAKLRSLLRYFQAEEFKYNTGEVNVDPAKFGLSDSDFSEVRKKALSMEGLQSDGTHVSFVTVKKLVGLPLVEDEVQDLIARTSEDLATVKEQIQDEDPGPVLTKLLAKASELTNSFRYHMDLLESIQEGEERHTLRHDDVLPRELITDFDEETAVAEEAAALASETLSSFDAAQISRRNSLRRMSSVKLSHQELASLLRESQAKEEEGSAKDSPADIRSDGEPKEEIDASENTRLKAKSEAASLAALQLVEQNELVVAHLLHMLARSMRRRFSLMMRDLLVGDEDPISLFHVPDVKTVARVEKRLIESSQAEVEQLPKYLAEIDDAINLRAFPKLASKIWWPVVNKFTEWADERERVDNITALQTMTVADFREVGFRDFEAVQLAQTIQRRKRKEKKEQRPRSCGASNLDMLRCSMTYSKPDTLVEAFNRLAEAYDNADNKFRYFVDNGYAMDGDWIATETSKFRAVTIHFVWRPFVDEPYGFGDLVDDFKSDWMRYVNDCPARYKSLASEALNRLRIFGETLPRTNSVLSQTSATSGDIGIAKSTRGGQAAGSRSSMSTDSHEAITGPVVEMVAEVRLIYQPFYDLGIRESGICYSIINAKTIKDVVRYMNVKPTELEQFNAAVHLQAQIRGFTTKLRIKREIMAERAARKAKAEKLQRFDQLVIELEQATAAEEFEIVDELGKEMDGLLQELHPKLTSKDIAACQSAYKEVDLDGNGALDIDEIGEMFKVLGMHMESHTLQALFDKFDKDGSGELDFHEFLDLRETMIPQVSTGSMRNQKHKRKKKRL